MRLLRNDACGSPHSASLPCQCERNVPELSLMSPGYRSLCNHLNFDEHSRSVQGAQARAHSAFLEDFARVLQASQGHLNHLAKEGQRRHQIWGRYVTLTYPFFYLNPFVSMAFFTGCGVFRSFCHLPNISDAQGFPSKSGIYEGLRVLGGIVSRILTSLLPKLG